MTEWFDALSALQQTLFAIALFSTLVFLQPGIPVDGVEAVGLYKSKSFLGKSSRLIRMGLDPERPTVHAEPSSWQRIQSIPTQERMGDADD